MITSWVVANSSLFTLHLGLRLRRFLLLAVDPGVGVDELGSLDELPARNVHLGGLLGQEPDVQCLDVLRDELLLRFCSALLPCSAMCSAIFLSPRVSRLFTWANQRPKLSLFSFMFFFNTYIIFAIILKCFS